MHESNEPKKALLNRRAFMTSGMIAAGAVTAGTMLPGNARSSGTRNPPPFLAQHWKPGHSAEFGRLERQ
jgi:hypothetical protein